MILGKTIHKPSSGSPEVELPSMEGKYLSARRESQVVRVIERD